MEIIKIINCKIKLFLVCPAWAGTNRWKSVAQDDSGDCIANGKGIHCEVESEGSQIH